MRVVIAPDKFKGSLTALQACRAIARGLRGAISDCATDLVPMADGGEGTVEAFLAAGARKRTRTVDGPLGTRVVATYACAGNAAIVEMASASGLQLLTKERYDPLHATTYGTGQLLAAAARDGVERCIVGLGGSATVDVGTGMLRALGVGFFDDAGNEISASMDEYERLARIDCSGLDGRVLAMEITVATDVDNPLLGENGAARVFGPQKGASARDVAVLERAAARIADVVAATLGRDERNAAGAGAAGGVGFALAAFLRARIEPGATVVAKAQGLDRKLAGADLCATGEGKIDLQTLEGKTVSGVSRMARAVGVPVVAFGGVVEPEAAAALKEWGVQCVETATGVPLDEALRRAPELLEKAARAYGAAARDARR